MQFWEGWFVKPVLEHTSLQIRLSVNCSGRRVIKVWSPPAFFVSSFPVACTILLRLYVRTSLGRCVRPRSLEWPLSRSVRLTGWQRCLSRPWDGAATLAWRCLSLPRRRPLLPRCVPGEGCKQRTWSLFRPRYMSWYIWTRSYICLCDSIEHTEQITMYCRVW